MDVSATAREIVEHALRATESHVDPQMFLSFETTPLSWFVKAEAVSEFLDRVIHAAAELGVNPSELKDLHEREPLWLLQSPVGFIVQVVEHLLRQIVEQHPIEVEFQPQMIGSDAPAFSVMAEPEATTPEPSEQAREEDPASATSPSSVEMDAAFQAAMEREAHSHPVAYTPPPQDDFEQPSRRNRPETGQGFTQLSPPSGRPPLPNIPQAPGPTPVISAPAPASAHDGPPLKSIGAASPPPQAPSPDSTRVQVFYATDRMQIPNLVGGTKYGKLRSLKGNLHYGTCEISIPKTHKIGKLETPSILRLEFRPDPEKHIVLAKTFSVAEEDFFKLVKSCVAKSATKDAFVFIHGYNVSFEDAARRTGQIAYDLDFVGAPIFYSWPSNGKTADYLKDETNITWSTPHFQNFLSLLAQKSGAARIHILAHSMGNRAVCDALKALSYDKNSQLKFNHLLLAAPDIDADTFRELAATLQRLSGRVTLYESSQDKALLASKKIHGNPRAGEPLLVVPGMDTIDASAIDTDFLGHSYFSDNWPLLADIHSILFNDQPASGRFGLVPMEHEEGKYYAFRR